MTNKLFYTTALSRGRARKVTKGTNMGNVMDPRDYARFQLESRKDAAIRMRDAKLTSKSAKRKYQKLINQIDRELKKL